MHDPMTVIGHWPRYGTRLYKLIGPQFTLWHVDPETDGSDDSCGWSNPKLTEADQKIVADLVREERHSPWISTAQTHVRNPRYQYHEARPGDGLALILATYCEVAWAADRRRMDAKLIEEAMALALHRHDNLMSTVLEPESLFWCVLRHYRGNRRRWYQHPRWHVRHWRLQIHFMQALRRWLFDRCATCGGRFAWGYCPTSDWNGTRLWHSECGNPNSRSTERAAVPQSPTQEGEK